MPSDWRVANEMSFIVLLFVWLAEEMREKKRCRKSKYLAISGQMNENTHIPNRAKKGVKTRSVELIECTTRDKSPPVQLVVVSVVQRQQDFWQQQVGREGCGTSETNPIPT